ncbi:hypothetical protein ACFRI7_00660 [Streptomyces sp. NPDC056716]
MRGESRGTSYGEVVIFVVQRMKGGASRCTESPCAGDADALYAVATAGR